MPCPLVALSQPATTTTPAKSQRLLYAVGRVFTGHLENSGKAGGQGAIARRKHYLSHRGIQRSRLYFCRKLVALHPLVSESACNDWMKRREICTTANSKERQSPRWKLTTPADLPVGLSGQRKPQWK